MWAVKSFQVIVGKIEVLRIEIITSRNQYDEKTKMGFSPPALALVLLGQKTNFDLSSWLSSGQLHGDTVA
jgi:hypothetical protein